MKKCFAFLALLAVIVALAVFTLKTDESNSIPKEGVYWISQDTYYAFEAGEEVCIGLECFTVQQEESNLLSQISEVAFLDENDQIFEVYNDYDISSSELKHYPENGFSVRNATFSVVIPPVESAVFTRIRYVLNGEVIEKKIGTIEVECSMDEQQTPQEEISSAGKRLGIPEKVLDRNSGISYNTSM